MTNYKTAPFDLQKFLDGEPICYRSGELPSDVHYFDKSPGKMKIATIDVDGDIFLHNDDGTLNISESCFDLFMQVRSFRKSAWVNVYKYGKIEGGFKNADDANKYYHGQHYDHVHNPRVACIEISWEEK